MRRIAIRLIVIGVIAGISSVIYLLSDFTSCSGPKVENWLDKTTNRMEAYNTDWESVHDSTTSSRFQYLASRAEDRYNTQLNENTPPCLSDLQEYTADLFYYEMNSYEALAEGNIDLAESYFIKEESSLDQISREIDRLNLKYSWDE